MNKRIHPPDVSGGGNILRVRFAIVAISYAYLSRIGHIAERVLSGFSRMFPKKVKKSAK